MTLSQNKKKWRLLAVITDTVLVVADLSACDQRLAARVLINIKRRTGVKNLRPRPLFLFCVVDVLL